MNTLKKVPDYLFTHDIRFAHKGIIRSAYDFKKFLVLKRSAHEFVRPDTWDIPGGILKFPELHQAGLKREVLEETGLEIKNMKNLTVFTSYETEKNIYNIILGSVADATQDDVQTSHEHQKYEWITAEQYFARNPDYSYIPYRLFNIHSTDFISDMVYLAYGLNF